MTTPPHTFAIVGAGLAGLACATALRAAGHTVHLVDKGRGPGGRMATRRLPTPQGDAHFDHGAQYFTARDPAFQTEVRSWQAAGLAARWPAAGPEAWVGAPSMNAPLKHLAAAQDIRWATTVTALTRVGDAWRLEGAGPDAYDAALVAIPAEQAGPLLAPHLPAWAALAAAHPAQPCWTVMAAFAAPVPYGPDVMTEHGPIGWAARDSAKPGRPEAAESWVIQAGPAWSAAHLEQTPADILPQLLDAFAARVASAGAQPHAAPLPPLLAAAAHRWRYARSGSAARIALWDPTQRLGLCGDWLLGPRVECAWLSGTALAASIGPRS